MIVRSKADSILNDIFSKNNWLKLSTTTPTETGGNFTEPPTSCGYRAKQLSEMGTPSKGVISNTDIMFIGEIITNAGKVTHFGIFASSSALTPIYYGEVYDEDGNLGITLSKGNALLIRKSMLKAGIDVDSLD